MAIASYYKSPNNDFTLIQGDCVETLSKFKFGFDMVFADPPYSHERLKEIPQLVADLGLLAEDGMLILEHPKDFDFSDDEHFFHHRNYGHVNFSFFR